MPDQEASLSIIASTHSLDRIHFLKSLLDSIAKQTNKDFEIIIVVDGNDDLCTRVQELIKSIKLDRVQIIHSKKQIGAAASRNLGVRVSRSSILGFVDDDVVLPLNVLDLFEKRSDIAGVCGGAYPLWDNRRDS